MRRARDGLRNARRDPNDAASENAAIARLRFLACRSFEHYRHRVSTFASPREPRACRSTLREFPVNSLVKDRSCTEFSIVNFARNIRPQVCTFAVPGAVRRESSFVRCSARTYGGCLPTRAGNKEPRVGSISRASLICECAGTGNPWERVFFFFLMRKLVIRQRIARARDLGKMEEGKRQDRD